MNGAKRTAEIQAGMKRTSANHKRVDPSENHKRKADSLNAENSEHFVRNAQAKRTSASD
jgi:hypothetical protein